MNYCIFELLAGVFLLVQRFRLKVTNYLTKFNKCTNRKSQFCGSISNNGAKKQVNSVHSQIKQSE